MKNLFWGFFLIILSGCINRNKTNISVNSDTLLNKTDSIKQITNNFDTSLVKTDNSVVTNSAKEIAVDTTIKSVFQDDYNLLVDSQLYRWTSYYTKMCSEFDIKEFKECWSNYLQPLESELDDKYELREFKNLQEFINLYKPFLIWNLDSTKAIDLYSTCIILSFDEFGNRCATGDVDCWATLIDFKNKKRLILQTVGTFGWFEDGFWIDDNYIVYTEIFNNIEMKQDDDEYYYYELNYNVVNLKTFEIKKYCSKKTYKLKGINYKKQFFKGVKF